MAEAHGEAVLLQRVCLGEQCHAVFFICSHCDRGHRYCSGKCRAYASRQQRRRANGRHQQSPEAGSTTATVSGITGAGAVKNKPA